MKQIIIPPVYGAKSEVANWLQENIGEENIRWWYDRRIYDQDRGGPLDTIMVDVTEEEEPMLTALLLKYS